MLSNELHLYGHETNYIYMVMRRFIGKLLRTFAHQLTYLADKIHPIAPIIIRRKAREIKARSNIMFEWKTDGLGGDLFEYSISVAADFNTKLPKLASPIILAKGTRIIPLVMRDLPGHHNHTIVFHCEFPYKARTITEKDFVEEMVVFCVDGEQQVNVTFGDLTKNAQMAYIRHLRGRIWLLKNPIQKYNAILEILPESF